MIVGRPTVDPRDRNMQPLIHHLPRSRSNGWRGLMQRGRYHMPDLVMLTVGGIFFFTVLMTGAVFVMAITRHG